MASWTGITSNKIVTDTDLNQAVQAEVFTPLSTIPLLNLGLTKARAQGYVNLDGVSISNIDSNQLLVKSDFLHNKLLPLYIIVTADAPDCKIKFSPNVQLSANVIVWLAPQVNSKTTPTSLAFEVNVEFVVPT